MRYLILKVRKIIRKYDEGIRGKDAVKQFIEYLKEPENLLKGCALYHKRSFDVTYTVVMKNISQAPDSIFNLLSNIALFLWIWNLPYYLRRHITEASVMNALLKAYQDCKNDLESLKQEHLESIDLQNKADLIKSCFKAFNQVPIRITGASKALHLLNPNLFMMWDSNIRAAYHRLHTKHPEEDCYVEFMKDCQRIAKAILTKTDQQSLWEAHYRFVDHDLAEKFGFPKESLSKMIDEGNYVRWSIKTNKTKGISEREWNIK